MHDIDLTSDRILTNKKFNIPWEISTNNKMIDRLALLIRGRIYPWSFSEYMPRKQNMMDRLTELQYDHDMEKCCQCCGTRFLPFECSSFTLCMTCDSASSDGTVAGIYDN